MTEPDSAAAIAEAHGPFSILVNNAGTDDFAFFTDMTPERWRRLIAINLEGVLICTHAVLPGNAAGGIRPHREHCVRGWSGRLKGSAVYSAAKGGVIAFTKTHCPRERPLRRHGKPMTPGRWGPPPDGRPKQLGEMGQDHRDDEGQTQIGAGQPEEVAAAVAFLASDDASYVTGETLGVSGGLGMV